MVILREIAETSQQSNECLNEQKLLMICIDSLENYKLIFCVIELKNCIDNSRTTKIGKNYNFIQLAYSENVAIRYMIENHENYSNENNEIYK